jgi:hypothetical protein
MTRVTFDDIPGPMSTFGVVPNGYFNLHWTNTQYINASSMLPSGYQRAVSSSPYVAHNPAGGFVMFTTANGTRFAFNSIVVSSAWRDSLMWTLYGRRAGSTVLAGTITMNPVNKTIISCSVSACSNLDTIYLFPANGTAHPGLAQNGTQFAFDDLCISFGY